MRPLLLAFAFALTAAPALANTYYRDNDKDGYGNPAVSVTANFPPYGYVSDHGDCNDNNPAIHPGANEICDGVDQDCNGAADDGVSPIPAYRDYDGDGYGQTSTMQLQCPVHAGWVGYDGDCNDADPRIHPSAVETCGNGIDDDCDGSVDEFCGAPFGIADVIDRPGDEGHAVLVRFHAHPYDVPAGAPVHVLEYRVQRRPMGAEGVPYTWETVATVPATQLADYEAVAPTWCDEPCIVTFVVRAIADVPGVAYDTAPDSGAAVDDTPPDTPAPIAATYTPGHVRLDWGPSPSPDVVFYRVYQDQDCDLYPQCAPFVVATRTPSEALTFTGPFDGRFHYFHYWVTAVDTAGNESGAAIPSTVGAEADAPFVLALAPAAPNPSRAGVTLSWTLPAAGDIALRVVDLAGRAVRTVAFGRMPAGTGTASWNGLDARGTPVRAGAYFARLDSPWGVRTRMVVRL